MKPGNSNGRMNSLQTAGEINFDKIDIYNNL